MCSDLDHNHPSVEVDKINGSTKDWTKVKKRRTRMVVVLASARVRRIFNSRRETILARG